MSEGAIHKIRFGFIAGPSGVGKGYGIGSILDEYHGANIFVTGDYCRKMAIEFANSGALVSDDLICRAVKENFEQKCSWHYFIDAPRSIEQVHCFIQMFTEVSPNIELHTLHIEATHHNCEHRLKDRAKRHGRKDDAKLEVIKKRLDAYFCHGGIRDTVIPILKKHTICHFIDGNEDMETIRKKFHLHVCPKIFSNHSG